MKERKNVLIGKTTVVEDDVIIGNNVVIGEYCIIKNGTIIGDNVIIGNFCVVGAEPNIRGAEKVSGSTYILEGTQIKDGVIICRSYDENSHTVISEECNVSYGVYIAHNCNVGKRVNLSSHVCLGGNVVIGNFSNIGTNAFVHQNLKIGDFCMIGAQAKVVRDIPHYALVDGIPAKVKRVNLVGLKKNGYDEIEIKEIEYFYNYIYKEAINRMVDFSALDIGSKGRYVLNFINDSLNGCTWKE